MRYEWDEAKEKINIKKHGVSFEEAKQALNCGLVVVLKRTPILAKFDMFI